MEIKPEDILLEAPIKVLLNSPWLLSSSFPASSILLNSKQELGSFDIPVRWEGNRTATLKLEVVKR